MKKIIIFLGAPGSGKGTQAKNIVKNYGYAHISTGESLRALAKSDNIKPEEQAALEAMKEGHLVPDWLIFRLAFDEIDECLKNGQGVVLDGAIRNVEQARGYQDYFAEKNIGHEVLAVEIHIDDNEALQRLAKRKICENCHKVYPSPETKTIPEKCLDCSGKLIVREDDDERVVKNRIAEQGSALIKPLHDFYEECGLLHVVDGKLSMEEVEEEIKSILMES